MEISAKKRQITSTKVKLLRKQGEIPAVIFSKKTSKGDGEVINVTVNSTDFKKIYAKAGESALITITVEEDGKHQALISEVQRDPLSLSAIHASFYEVDLSEKIDTHVPVEIINENQNQIVKAGEGIILAILTEVEVRSLPQDIPQHLDIDVSGLKNVGEDVLTVKDLKVDASKVEILTDLDEVIVKLDYAEQLEVVEEEPADVSDVEVISEEEAAKRQAEKEAEEKANPEKKEAEATESEEAKDS